VVAEGNPALELYRSLGFTPVGEQQHWTAPIEQPA
jgi:hypothetical protein